MNDVGIGEVFIGDIFYMPPSTNPHGLSYDTPMGKTPSLSEKWWDCMRHAISEGTRLGINISFFNSPGWSQSGGPWVKEEQAMRYLTYSETVVSGDKSIEIALEKPKEFFHQLIKLPLNVKHLPKVKTSTSISQELSLRSSAWISSENVCHLLKTFLRMQELARDKLMKLF